MNKKYRKTIIAGNWKMNLLPSEARPYYEELRAGMPKSKICETVLCAPFTSISPLRRAMKDNRVAVGAQDVSVFENGAYTGEIAADMLADAGVKYVTVGHSERREYHGENDFTVGKKAAAVVEAGMNAIICVGESLEQRQRGITMEFIATQLISALSFIPADKIKNCVIAYEPIWAIGTGVTATAEEAQEVCLQIRRVIRERYDARIARGTSILYGGSMKGSNAVELLSMPDIDGGLIGGASLKPADFLQIINAVETVEKAEK